MTTDQTALPVPPEAERLRDALQDVISGAVRLLRDAKKPKGLLARGLEPRPEDWPEDEVEGRDAAPPCKSGPVDRYGWRRLLLILREDLHEFWAAHDEAQAANNALPAQVVRILSDTGESHWTVRVRKTLDSLGTWHYSTRPHETKLRTYPPDVASLIGLLREGLPDWTEPLTSIRGFQDDLYTPRGEASSCGDYAGRGLAGLTPLATSATGGATADRVREGIVADGPAANGYVETPTDPKAYAPVSDIVNTHTPLKSGMTVKKVSEVADNYHANRVRWTRPKDKQGDPICNRRSIHLGDWAAYLKRRTGTDGDGFPGLHDLEIQDRIQTIRKTKRRGK